MKLGLLPQNVGVSKSMLHLVCTGYIEGRELL